jgi:hypothetical protein
MFPESTFFLIVHTFWLVFHIVSSEQCWIFLKYAFVLHCQFPSYTSKLSINWLVAAVLSTFSRKWEKKAGFQLHFGICPVVFMAYMSCSVQWGNPAELRTWQWGLDHCWELSVATQLYTKPTTCIDCTHKGCHQHKIIQYYFRVCNFSSCINFNFLDFTSSLMLHLF